MVGVGRGSFLRLVRSKSEPPPSPREPSDPLASLAKAAAEGDGAAIRTFLSSVGACLLRVVRSVLGAQHPDVDDVVQEAPFAVQMKSFRRALMPMRCGTCSTPCRSSRRKF